MNGILHITSGDICGNSLAISGIEGEVFVWHDSLYDGPRKPGWPDRKTLEARSLFIEEETGGGLGRKLVLEVLGKQYEKLAAEGKQRPIVLWFDACLFDQSMLCHILNCLRIKNISNAELLCLDSFPGIVPFNGLGQLSPSQLFSLYNRRIPVTEEMLEFAEKADRAFALQDKRTFEELAKCKKAPLPWVPAAVKRWIEEQPDETGLGKLQKLALEAVRSGKNTPFEIFTATAAADTHPQYWGDTTLWAKINSLADMRPPLVKIEGPEKRLPQWEKNIALNLFRISPAEP